jgi:hypothetical protein
MRASDSTSHSLYSSRLTFVQNFRFKKAVFGPPFLLIIFISKLLCFGNLSNLNIRFIANSLQHR